MEGRFIEYAPHVPPVNKKESNPSEVFVARAVENMKTTLPAYSVLDRSVWDAYDEAADRAGAASGKNKGNGTYLTFYQGEISPENPRLDIVRKFDGGYTINFANNSLAHNNSETHIVPRAGSVYKNPGPNPDEYWSLDEMDLAIETTRMFMEGIPLTAEVVDAPTFVVGSENRVATLREVLEKAREYKQASRSQRAKLSRADFSPKDVFVLEKEAPDVVAELARQRIEYKKAHGLPIRADGQEAQRELLQTGVYSDILGISRGLSVPPLTLPE